MKKNSRSGKYTIECGSEKISCSVIHSNRRGMRIVVLPGPYLNVFAPKNSSESYIRGVLKKKAPWIKKSIVKLKNCFLIAEPEIYAEGDKINYLGCKYPVKIDMHNIFTPELNEGVLHVGAGKGSSPEKIKKRVDSWYRTQAEKIFNKYMNKCIAAVSPYGIPRPFFTVRKMRSRWGSCRLSGKITLNLYLVQLPEQCIEYVIMHELCHLKHPDHSADFYAFLSECLPDWKEKKRILDNMILP